MISLIHPSRGRPEKAHDTAWTWAEKSGLPSSPALMAETSEFEYIISLDLDDPYKDKYSELFLSQQKVISNNKSVVEATNKAAEYCSGDIIVYLSDDFQCPNNWGQLLIAEFAKYSGPTLIKVDDCLQKFNVPVLTIPIMNRELYNKLGYFFHPDFKSMFCDEHLYWKTYNMGALKLAPHLKFEHCHVSVGKAPDDETYRRSARNWEQGKAMFAKHKRAGFP